MGEYEYVPNGKLMNAGKNGILNQIQVNNSGFMQAELNHKAPRRNESESQNRGQNSQLVVQNTVEYQPDHEKKKMKKRVGQMGIQVMRRSLPK